MELTHFPHHYPHAISSQSPKFCQGHSFFSSPPTTIFVQTPSHHWSNSLLRGLPASSLAPLYLFSRLISRMIFQKNKIGSCHFSASNHLETTCVHQDKILNLTLTPNALHVGSPDHLSSFFSCHFQSNIELLEFPEHTMPFHASKPLHILYPHPGTIFHLSPSCAYPFFKAQLMHASLPLENFLGR